MGTQSAVDGRSTRPQSDQERAIGALKHAVKNERPEDIMMEESPVGESQSNGIIERAIQEVEAQVRTIRLNVEERLNIKIPRDHDSIGWLVKFAGACIR